MIQFIKSIPDWGLRPEMSVHQMNHLRLTNVLLLLMFCASFFLTAALFFSGATEAALLNSSAPFVFGGALLLMKFGYTTLGRLMVITVAYTISYGMCTVLGEESHFQFILLFGSAFSVVFFSREEKLLLTIGLLSALSVYALLEINHYEPVWGLSRANLSPSALIFMRIMSATLVWGLMVGHFFYFVKRRRISQDQLISSSKMVAMGRMAAGIAHEVNNPLQRIVGHADRLKFLASSGTVAPEQISVLSEQIQVVAMRIASIVKGLLALSRDASNDPFADVPVNTVVKLALDYSRARLESHSVELRIGDISPVVTVIGRETQLSEVLLNLISNSFDAVVDRNERWIQIEAMAHGNSVEISVTDSGAGLSADVRNKVFDPFFTTKPVGKGTGLGLSISHGIMSAHGGDLFYDEKSPRTRFVIRARRGTDLEKPYIHQVNA